jgi:hypothetical protein
MKSTDLIDLAPQEADDFEKEVEALRSSQAFQRFLDERSRSTGRISLDEVEAESER